MNTPYSASSWVDMFVQVMKFLFELDETIIYKLVENKDGLGSNFISKETEGFTEIANNVFVWTANNTMTKIRMLRQVFDQYELDYSELEIEIEGIEEDTI